MSDLNTPSFSAPSASEGAVPRTSAPSTTGGWNAQVGDWFLLPTPQPTIFRFDGALWQREPEDTDCAPQALAERDGRRVYVQGPVPNAVESVEERGQITPFLSGPGHAAQCDDLRPHRMHRHPHQDSYEVCGGVNATPLPRQHCAIQASVRFAGGYVQEQYLLGPFDEGKEPYWIDAHGGRVSESVIERWVLLVPSTDQPLTIKNDTDGATGAVPAPSEALEEEPPVGSVVLDREGYPHHREERGWMSTDPAGPAHVSWSTVRDVCGPLTLLVPAPAPAAVPEGRWTYNPESHVALSREVVVILKQCVSPAAEQFSSEIREAVDAVNEALSAWNMHRVAQMQAPGPTPVGLPLPSEAVEAARTWIANCVDPVVVGPVAKQAMLDYLDGRRDRPTDEDFQRLRALPAADQDARDEGTVRDALVIRVGRLAGSQDAARELTAEVTKGTPVVLDFRDNRSTSPSFVGALLFYATFPPDNTNSVEVVNASPEVVEAAEAWIAQSGRVTAETIRFR